MDWDHLMVAARYVALIPVRARLTTRAQDWPHSSVRAHLAGRDDARVAVRPLLARAPRFADLIEGEGDEAAFTPLRRSEAIGRPLGSPAFLETAARRLGRVVTPATHGRKPTAAGAEAEGQSKREIRACHRNSIM